MTIRSRRLFLTGIAASLAASALASGAFAQTYRDDRRGWRPEPSPRAAGARGPVCQPMCDTDPSPCDSPAQKAADGRCSSPTAGQTR